MINFNKPLVFDRDSPVAKACSEPQLMFVRHMGFSSYFKNKQRNQQLHDEWVKSVRGLQTRTR